MDSQGRSGARMQGMITGLCLLGIAGMILALSWMVNFPRGVMIAAWIVALAGVVAAVALGWRRARADGDGLLQSLRAALRALKDFVANFF